MDLAARPRSRRLGLTAEANVNHHFQRLFRSLQQTLHDPVRVAVPDHRRTHIAPRANGRLARMAKIAETTMTQLTNSRLAWFNGKFMPENQVLIPFRDRSWRYGDGAFDMTRTFNGRAFRLKEHIDRFYCSLRYLRLDPRMSPREMIDVSEQIVVRNEHLRGAAGDWWIGQRVSRGVDPIGDEVPEHSGPNVVVECTPLPLKARARQFRDGLDVWTPAQRRIAPDMLSPRAKTHNYLNMIVAEQSVKAHDPEGWAVLLDVNGNLAEGMGSNIFVVRGGTLYTPSERYVLPGISRQMTLDLARQLAIQAIEGDIDLFDAATAEEMFLTSTSLCIAGVRSFNGAKIGDGRAPGPITKRLTDAYIAEVGCDFVKQYLDRLS
jgi:branched-chain amino acid aminotransferase